MKVQDMEIAERLAKRKYLQGKIARLNNQIKNLEIQMQLTRKEATKKDCAKRIQVARALIARLAEEIRAA